MRSTNRSSSPTAARAGLIAVLALAAAALAGCSAPAVTATTYQATPSPTPTPRPTAEGPAIPRTDGRLSAQDMSPTVPPVRITVPAASIDMQVLPQGLGDDGQMAVPSDSRIAGWYEFGSGPMSAAGTTVIVAHIDARVGGVGPFSRIRDLPAGSPIAIQAGNGSVHNYVTTAVQEVAKEGAPMADYFDRAGPPRLILITCGGKFNAATGHYLDNIVVTATPQ
ncbi:class F sortase [Lacisediminihabitans changchengi]|uniref:Class F sortase n=1 Tax=Lacisediminihabitans changchengi TaxID=2787634 RepID=A0A934SKW6_9MICO|nr:class F sortase [Lacisediminihabitans changchengi]MBK4348577.1 class F sortase [Lacisediminihabitans changchengi]